MITYHIGYIESIVDIPLGLVAWWYPVHLVTVSAGVLYPAINNCPTKKKKVLWIYHFSKNIMTNVMPALETDWCLILIIKNYYQKHISQIK